MTLGLLCNLLLGCNAHSGAHSNARYERIPLSQTALQAVKTGVKAPLKAPHSARFQRLQAVRGPRGIMVCGLVNSQNGFGGYTGHVPFNGFLVGHTYRVNLIGSPTSRIQRGIIKGQCGSYGIGLE